MPIYNNDNTNEEIMVEECALTYSCRGDYDEYSGAYELEETTTTQPTPTQPPLVRTGGDQALPNLFIALVFFIFAIGLILSFFGKDDTAAQDNI